MLLVDSSLFRHQRNIPLTEEQKQVKVAKIIEINVGKIKFTKHNDALNQEECSVCLDSFMPDEELCQITNCKHLFHEKCLSLWIKQKID